MKYVEWIKTLHYAPDWFCQSPPKKNFFLKKKQSSLKSFIILIWGHTKNFVPKKWVLGVFLDYFIKKKFWKKNKKKFFFESPLKSFKILTWGHTKNFGPKKWFLGVLLEGGSQREKKSNLAFGAMNGWDMYLKSLVPLCRVITNRTFEVWTIEAVNIFLVLM